jgi:5-carboxymethyl-2-hydroxymuconate isomerase
MEGEMTALQIEYTKYVRKIAYIDGLLQAMLHHIVENDVESIHNIAKKIHELDPIGSGDLMNEVKKLSTVEE